MIQDIMRSGRASLEDWEHVSDEDILTSSKSSPEVFEVLVIRYEDAFLRKAKRILFSNEDAQEVVQDTFTRIYLYADKFSPQEGAVFSSWAYAILMRQCFTRYAKVKKERGRTQELDAEVYERLPDTEHFMTSLTSRDEVLVALSKIPEQARRVLTLQFLEGKTHEEIAVLEGSTIPAIKTRVHRAKKLFKKAFTYE